MSKTGYVPDGWVGGCRDERNGLRDEAERLMRQSRGAGVTGGRGGGHARQSQYSTTAKSGVNSQKALFILMRVPIPISKVRYQKEATATYLSHCHGYRRRGRLATTEGEESRVRGARKPMGKKSAAALHRRTGVCQRVVTYERAPDLPRLAHLRAWASDSSLRPLVVHKYAFGSQS